jgi:hypothetical protein
MSACVLVSKDCLLAALGFFPTLLAGVELRRVMAQVVGHVAHVDIFVAQ